MKFLDKYDVPEEVRMWVMLYLEKHNLGELVYIQRKSNHPEDWYLFEVVARYGNEYRCWTTWNETTQSLNNGHYGLKTFEEAMETINKYYRDCR